jgi:prepilin-type N-terminal cleavage/methylation domain-containing protein
MNGARSEAPTRGLTLVELLVALFLLALLTQAAVLATDGLFEQGQQAATVRSLEAIATAVLGDETRRDANGRPVLTGFVADHGRLPLAGPTTARLEELVQAPTDPNLLFGYRQPMGDPEVFVGCGWRGPYAQLGSRLQTGPSTPALRDAWNNPFACWSASDGATQALPGEPAAIVRSLGADGLLGGTGAGADLPLVFERTATPDPVAARWRGTVHLRVLGTPNADVVVRIYGASGSMAVTQWQWPSDPMALHQIPASGSLVLTSAPVPIGPRLVRVYRSPFVTPDTDLSGAVAKSSIVPIVVLPVANPELVITLP